MVNKKKKEAYPGPAGLPLSSVVAFGDLVFVSGYVGRNYETNEIAHGDIAAQTKQAMENVGAQLNKVGSSLENVLKATVFISDMGLFDKMNEVYITYFPTDLPARSCVEVVTLADKDALVEIEVVAWR